MTFVHLHRPCIEASRLMSNGYPTAQWHRKALEAKLGRPLLPGYETHHKCENKACIEPEHLEEKEMVVHRREHLLAKPRGQRTGPTTDEWKENISRALTGRQLTHDHKQALSAGQAARTDRRMKLSEEEEVEIRARVVGGEKYRPLAAEYGVAVSTITNVVRRG